MTNLEKNALKMESNIIHEKDICIYIYIMDLGGLIMKMNMWYIKLCMHCRALMNQVFYFVGLNNSTPTIACALTNILPAMTFVFAVFFRYRNT